MVNKRRIFPTLALLSGVGGLGILACHGFEIETAAPLRLLHLLLAPQAARADDGASANASAIMRNPFADADNSDDAAESSQPEPQQAPIAVPRVANQQERYRSPPALEPVRQRRTNPHLAADNDEPADNETVNEAEHYPAAKRLAVTPRSTDDSPRKPALDASIPRARAIDRYAKRKDADIVREDENVPSPAEAGATMMVADRADVPASERTPDRAAAQTGLAPVEPAPAEVSERSSGDVSLQWITPSTVTVGQEATCQLVVRNASDAVAHGVLVDIQLPDDVDLGSTDPASIVEGRLVSWRLGDLAPGATTTTQLSITSHRQGDVMPRAAVTFTRQVAANIQIVEPRLAMSIEGPHESVAGQPVAYQFRVTNQGPGPAVGVAVDVAMDKGLEAVTGSKSRYTIGTLGPDESRHVQVVIVGSEQGEFVVRGRAVVGERALGDASHAIRIAQPALAVEMDGPKLRLVDRKAAYTIKVQNPGPAPIDNVQLLESIPDGFRFVEASSGGSYDRSARQVAWFVGRLEANETATVGVQLIAVEAGDHRLNAAARSDSGVIGEAETSTRVKGSPRVTIDIAEDDDPVEVDSETIYRVRLANQGSTPARRVQFAGEVPAEMEILDVNGPDRGTIKGRQLVFPPVDVLEPGQSVAYDVHVKCRKAGQVRFKAYFRSEDAPAATLEEEATRIYAD